MADDDGGSAEGQQAICTPLEALALVGIDTQELFLTCLDTDDVASLRAVCKRSRGMVDGLLTWRPRLVDVHWSEELDDDLARPRESNTWYSAVSTALSERRYPHPQYLRLRLTVGPTCPSAPELLHPLRVAADAGARLRHVSRLLLHVRADTWHVRRLNAVWDAGVLWELPGELFEAVTRVVMRDLNDRFHSKLAALRPTGGLAGVLARLFPHLEELRLTGDALLPTPFELYVQRIIDEALQDVLNDAVAGAAAVAAAAVGAAGQGPPAVNAPAEDAPANDAPAEAGGGAAGAAGAGGNVGGGGGAAAVLGAMQQAAVEVGRAAVCVDAAVAGHVLGCLAAGLPRLRGLAASSQLLLQPSVCVLTGLQHVTVLSPLQLEQLPGAVLRLPQLRTLTLERVESRLHDFQEYGGERMPYEVLTSLLHALPPRLQLLRLVNALLHLRWCATAGGADDGADDRPGDGTTGCGGASSRRRSNSSNSPDVSTTVTDATGGGGASYDETYGLALRNVARPISVSYRQSLIELRLSREAAASPAGGAAGTGSAAGVPPPSALHTATPFASLPSTSSSPAIIAPSATAAAAAAAGGSRIPHHDRGRGCELLLGSDPTTLLELAAVVQTFGGAIALTSTTPGASSSPEAPGNAQYAPYLEHHQDQQQQQQQEPYDAGGDQLPHPCTHGPSGHSPAVPLPPLLSVRVEHFTDLSLFMVQRRYRGRDVVRLRQLERFADARRGGRLALRHVVVRGFGYDGTPPAARLLGLVSELVECLELRLRERRGPGAGAGVFSAAGVAAAAAGSEGQGLEAGDGGGGGMAVGGGRVGAVVRGQGEGEAAEDGDNSGSVSAAAAVSSSDSSSTSTSTTTTSSSGSSGASGTAGRVRRRSAYLVEGAVALLRALAEAAAPAGERNTAGLPGPHAPLGGGSSGCSGSGSTAGNGVSAGASPAEAAQGQVSQRRAPLPRRVLLVGARLCEVEEVVAALAGWPGLQRAIEAHHCLP